MNGVLAKAFPIDTSNRYGRADRSAVGRWFWEIDRVLLLLIAVLIGIGLIAVAAASPAAGQRYSGGSVRIAELHYFYRQLMWIAASVPVMIAISMVPRESLRRWSIAGAVLFLALLAVVPIFGEEKNGAIRWINIGVGQLQPSEFLKPFFVVAMAWLLSLRDRDKSLPVYPISAVIVGGIAYLLMKQPDFGSTIIFCSVWVAMLALAGVNMMLFYLTTARRLQALGPDPDALSRAVANAFRTSNAAPSIDASAGRLDVAAPATSSGVVRPMRMWRVLRQIIRAAL